MSFGHKTRFDIEEVAGKAKKNARANLLLYAETKENIAKIAAVWQTSFNNLVNEILTQFAEQHIDVVQAYNKFFSQHTSDRMNPSSNLEGFNINDDPNGCSTVSERPKRI